MRTIIVASGVYVQGCFVRMLENGRAIIRVGNIEYTGELVTSDRHEKGWQGNLPAFFI
jgi:hypothetical protein